MTGSRPEDRSGRRSFPFGCVPGNNAVNLPQVSGLCKHPRLFLQSVPETRG